MPTNQKAQKSSAVFLRLHAPQIFLKLKDPPHPIVSQGWYMEFYLSSAVKKYA